MTSESSSNTPPNSDQPPSGSPGALQAAIRARALHTIERSRDVRKRSPKQTVIAFVLMLVAVFAFLFAVSLGTRTLHRIIDLWLQIREQAQQPAPPDVTQPYRVTVEPAPPDSSSSSAGSGAH